MEKNTGKVREFCHPGKVGTLTPLQRMVHILLECIRVVLVVCMDVGLDFNVLLTRNRSRSHLVLSKCSSLTQ